MMYARAKTNEGCFFWQPTAATWSDAKQRVLSSYRDWLRAVCLIFFLILKQYYAGRKGRKEKKKEKKQKEGEEYGHGKKSTDHRYMCVWGGITGTGSPNDVFAQYARVENSNQSSTGI